MTVGSLALLVVYPAFCQLVLKKRKMGTCSQNVNVNVINANIRNSNGPRSVPLQNFKNNNITLNNEKNEKDKQYSNLLKNEKNLKADDIDVEIANEEDDAIDKCSARSWSSMYEQLTTLKWFTVSN